MLLGERREKENSFTPELQEGLRQEIDGPQAEQLESVPSGQMLQDKIMAGAGRS